MLPLLSNVKEGYYIAGASIEYADNTGENGVTITMVDDGAGAYFKIKTEGEPEFNDKEELIQIIDDFYTRLTINDNDNESSEISN